MKLDRLQISKRALFLSASIYIFSFVIVVVNTILFVLGYSISEWSLLISLIATIVILIFVAKNYFPQRIVLTVVSTVILLSIIILISVLNAGNVYDFGYDGQTYHQQTIIELTSGWNPFSGGINTFHKLWVNHYPKARHILGAVIFSLTNNIEAGKCFNILFVLATFLLSLSFILHLTTFKIIYAIIISIILAFNPVSIFQLHTFMCDGLVGSLLTSLLLLCAFLSLDFDYIKLALFSIIIILLINIKFSSLAYSLIFVLMFLLILIVLKQTSKLKPILLAVLISYVVGIFVVGYNPYITNLKSKGNMFYPLMGENKFDIITNNLPAELRNKNRFEKLFLVTFAKADNYVGETSRLQFKPPFTFDIDELKVHTPDLRMGGFGIFWNSIVVLTLLVLIITFINRREIQNFFTIYIIIIVSIFLSVIVNPECWWARFVPQFWLIPTTIGFASLFYNSKIIKTIGIVLITVLLLNVFSFSYTSVYYHNFYTSQLKDALKYLANSGKTYEIYFGVYKSNILRYKNAGVKFVEIMQEREKGLVFEWGIVKVYRKDDEEKPY